MIPEEHRRGVYLISTDPARLDPGAIHAFLSTNSHWALGIPKAVVAKSIAHSLPFGVYATDGSQVGFARVITDYATFAYLCDVYVLPAHRGQGLARWLMQCVVASPRLQGLRRWMLATRDAHRLYEEVGFRTPGNPAALMEIVRPGVYRLDAGRPVP